MNGTPNIAETIRQTDKRQPLVEGIKKTDVTSAEIVEKGDNGSGRTVSSREEFSKAEQLFNVEQGDKVQNPVSEGGTVQKEDPLISSGQRIGYDSGEVKKIDTENDIRDSGYWIGIGGAGVPV